jgi:hypothetical protein
VDGLDTYHAWNGTEMIIHFWAEYLKVISQLEEMIVDVKT